MGLNGPYSLRAVQLIEKNMIKVLLIIFGSLILPTVAYVIWRTFAPERYGGSKVIAKDEWEPLPWPWLMGTGGIFLLLTLVMFICFPDLFGEF